MWRHIDVQADWRRSWTYGRTPNAIEMKMYRTTLYVVNVTIYNFRLNNVEFQKKYCGTNIRAPWWPIMDTQKPDESQSTR